MKKIAFTAGLCCFCGGGMGLCLLFPAFGPFVFLLGIPVFFFLEKQTTSRGMFGLCACFCLGLCAVGYAPALSIDAGLGQPATFWVDLGVYVVICLIHGLFLSVALWLGFRLPLPVGWRWLSVSFLWTLAEWLLGLGPFAWPTLRLSLALWQYPALIQWARFGGQLAVSMLIMAVNGLLSLCFGCFKSRTSLVSLGLAVSLLVTSVVLFGTASVPTQTDTTLGVVQPGMTVIRENRGDIYERSLALAREAARESPQLLILPESILPSGFIEFPLNHRPWQEIAGAGTDVLMGGMTEGHAAVIQFDAKGDLTTPYSKQREVPFFENGVGKRDFRWFSEDSAGIMTTQTGSVGVMICYESMFSSMSRNAAKSGANMLVVLTNDSWFKSDAAQRLHMGHGVFRALETGRTLVQAGLNGTTAVVDAAGQVTDMLPVGEQGILYTAVSTSPTDTPYLLWGNGWLLVPGVVLLLMWLDGFLRNRKK